MHICPDSDSYVKTHAAMKFAMHVSQNDTGASKPVKDISADLYAALSSRNSQSPIRGSSPKADDEAYRPGSVRRSSSDAAALKRPSLENRTSQLRIAAAENKPLVSRRGSTRDSAFGPGRTVTETELSARRGGLRKVF